MFMLQMLRCYAPQWKWILCLQRLRCYAPQGKLSHLRILSTNISVLRTSGKIIPIYEYCLQIFRCYAPSYKTSIEPGSGEIFVENNAQKTEGATHRNLYFKYLL